MGFVYTTSHVDEGHTSLVTPESTRRCTHIAWVKPSDGGVTWPRSVGYEEALGSPTRSRWVGDSLARGVLLSNSLDKFPVVLGEKGETWDRWVK
ncbi:hypothetical protein MLD38_039854 [Melastoma candidum]|uniref:Uncharacterized protein n=1 Tax=Melastoma candidum TaxID=119954 RepID=A0ACB9L3F4_9MYRT|nr:hypothetical protein MLD38_039854 [Melastoma candidum]